MLPAIADDLGGTPAGAGQTISLFALGYGVMQIALGPLGDRYGQQQVIRYACSACALANLAAALAPSLPLLLFARLLGGAGAAAVIPLGMAWIGDTVPYRARQATLARLMIGTALGLVAAQSLSGLVAAEFGWRAMFVFIAILFVLCVIPLRHGAQPVSHAASSERGNWRMVVAHPWARTILLATFLEGAAVFGVLAWLPSQLSTSLSISPARAGLVSAAYGLGALIFLAIAGPLLVRFGERGLSAVGGGLFALATASLLMPLPLFGAALACGAAGFGFYMLHNTLQVHATQMTPSNRGTAVSLFASVLFLGQSAGVFAAAEAQSLGELDTFFALASGLVLVLGASMALSIGRRNARQSSRQGNANPCCAQSGELQ